MIYFPLEVSMENQNNTGAQNTQQVGQNPVSQPISLPEKPKVNYWMISTVLLLIILLASGAWFVLNTKNRTSLNQQPGTSSQANETVATGVLRTSGLSEEEKQKFGLATVNYQITDFKASQEGQVTGYYLLSNAISDELLGKCVRVAGMIPQEWKSKNKGDSYNRLALNIANIEKIDNSSCNPYSQIPPTVDNTQEKLVLRGTAIHGKRPSPDIGYDYQLKLVEPFVDKFSSAGSPQKVNLVDISPSTDSIWIELENNINKEINVEGYMVWGYAESRFLSVINVSRSSFTEAINIITAIPEIQTIEKSVIKAGRKPFYTPEGENGDIVKISLRESFPDDPHTSRIDTFNINIKSKVITVEDVVSGKDISLEEWKKTVKERFQ